MVAIGQNGGFSDPFFPRRVAADAHGLLREGGGGVVRAEDVFGPLHGESVGAVEEGFIVREMAEAKFVVGHCEMPGCEFLRVFLFVEADVARAPAGVDEFPFAVVDFDGVPGVVHAFGGDGLTRFERGETGAFAVAGYDEGFEAGFCGEGGEEAGVAFADGEACGEGVGWGGGLDAVVAEGFDVVGDVMVEPGEDCAGLVGGGRGEGGGELLG